MQQYTLTRNLSDKTLPVENQRVLCMDKQHWFVGYYLEGKWYQDGFVSPVKNKVILWYEIPKHFKDLTSVERLDVISVPLPEKDRKRIDNILKYRKLLKTLRTINEFLIENKLFNKKFVYKTYHKTRAFILAL